MPLQPSKKAHAIWLWVSTKWFHFGVGAPPILDYFGGIGMFTGVRGFVPWPFMELFLLECSEAYGKEEAIPAQEFAKRSGSPSDRRLALKPLKKGMEFHRFGDSRHFRSAWTSSVLGRGL